MSFTEEEKAYHLKKIRTHFTRLDVNQDGFISREDYEEIGRKVAEYGKLNEEEAATTHSAFLAIADHLDLKPGVKHTIEEATQKVHKNVLSLPIGKNKELCDLTHGIMFDAFDTNKDGHISYDEFQVYYRILAPKLQEHVLPCFNTIDADKDGVISREEFLAAAFEFMCGMKETAISNSFFGPLE